MSQRIIRALTLHGHGKYAACAVALGISHDAVLSWLADRALAA